jgi:hypothetical protein
VILPDDLPQTYVCRYGEEEKLADARHFFPHRASGGLHLKSRCRTCEKFYRAGLAAGYTERAAEPAPSIWDGHVPEPGEP